MKKFSELNVTVTPNLAKALIGLKIKMSSVLNRDIIVHDYRIAESIHHKGEKCLHLQINLDGAMRVVFTGSVFLMDVILKIPKEDLPFIAKIVEINQMFQFTD